MTDEGKGGDANDRRGPGKNGANRSTNSKKAWQQSHGTNITKDKADNQHGASDHNSGRLTSSTASQKDMESNKQS
jgi:hypothetical protein